MVLDLGGGTFDVTVLEIVEGVIEIQASAGDARLGGEDFDDIVAEVFAARVREQHGDDPRADRVGWARVREAAELAKKRLSDHPTVSMTLVDLPIGRQRLDAFATTLTREAVEAAWAPLLDRMRGPIQRALRDAALAPDRIDEVLLVGGSTRMPCVARLAAQLFGKLPLRTLPPDEAVALGAAVQAALKAGDKAVDDLVATDIAPFTMGISSVASVGEQRIGGVFSPILERGTVIPASRVRRYTTVQDHQTVITIEVYQGEHSLAADNRKLGEYSTPGLRPARAGEESVDVRFTYDLNGILEVETTVVSTAKKASLVLEQTPGRMTQSQIDGARRAMARLKFHPRDALPNVTALARADALFVELSGPSREALGLGIARLRAALDTQLTESIDEAREALNHLLTLLRKA